MDGNVYPGNKISLPTYPFHGEKYWYPTARRSWKGEKLGLKSGRRVCDSCFGVIYEFEFSANSPLIRDHQIGGSYLFPGNGMVAAVCCAIQQEFPNQRFRLMDVRISEALILNHLTPGEFSVIQLCLTKGGQDEYQCRLLSCTSKKSKRNSDWRENLSCRFVVGYKALVETKEGDITVKL